jgi:hypothetical protein
MTMAYLAFDCDCLRDAGQSCGQGIQLGAVAFIKLIRMTASEKLRAE